MSGNKRKRMGGLGRKCEKREMDRQIAGWREREIGK